jgi:hypothetical protein
MGSFYFLLLATRKEVMEIKGRGLWGDALYVGNAHLDELVKSQKTPSPLTGISASLINWEVFGKIPIGIFDNRPAIYRR